MNLWIIGRKPHILCNYVYYNMSYSKNIVTTLIKKLILSEKYVKFLFSKVVLNIIFVRFGIEIKNKNV